jgi:hypothetical protein
VGTPPGAVNWASNVALMATPNPAASCCMTLATPVGVEPY